MTAQDGPRAARSALDLLLTDAGTTTRRRFLPGGSALRLGAAIVQSPRRLGRNGADVASSLASVVTGGSEVEPPARDRRYADSAWRQNWWFRRLMQGHLVLGEGLDRLISEAGLEVEDERRVRFAAEAIFEALAPSNFPVTNPVALKAALDSGGANFVRGGRAFLRDVSRAPRLPASADITRDLALTPGAVVLRNEGFELLQYRPQTSAVRSVPVVLVPPMINKYYVLDLAPDRSLVEHLLRSGLPVFAISWRNPDRSHAHFDLATYAAATVDAIDAACDIAGTEQAHVAGFCSGGMSSAVVAAHLAALGEADRLASLSLAVCVLDYERAGTAGALLSREAAALAVGDSARRGYLDGRALADVFAWLRPNDLIWSYVVNNYLLGKPPPKFDVLHWNADTTRLAAGLHRDLIEVALENVLVHPGRLELLGTPIDLRAIEADSYVVAGLTDHITPWESCHRSVGLLGGDTRFVLSTSGHVQALVNPPGNPKARFRTHEGATSLTPAQWLAGAVERPGTWWDDWVAWLGARSGSERRAPKRLGNRRFQPADKAPGTYVLQA